MLALFFLGLTKLNLCFILVTKNISCLSLIPSNILLLLQHSSEHIVYKIGNYIQTLCRPTDKNPNLKWLIWVFSIAYKNKDIKSLCKLDVLQTDLQPGADHSYGPVWYQVHKYKPGIRL